MLRVVEMFKSGALDAATAMTLLSGVESQSRDAKGSDDELDAKRKREVLSPSKDSEAASPAPKEARGELDSSMNYVVIYVYFLTSIIH